MIAEAIDRALIGHQKDHMLVLDTLKSCPISKNTQSKSTLFFVIICLYKAISQHLHIFLLLPL